MVPLPQGTSYTPGGTLITLDNLHDEGESDLSSLKWTHILDMHLSPLAKILLPAHICGLLESPNQYRGIPHSYASNKGSYFTEKKEGIALG